MPATHRILLTLGLTSLLWCSLIALAHPREPDGVYLLLFLASMAGLAAASYWAVAPLAALANNNKQARLRRLAYAAVLYVSVFFIGHLLGRAVKQLMLGN